CQTAKGGMRHRQSGRVRLVRVAGAGLVGLRVVGGEAFLVVVVVSLGRAAGVKVGDGRARPTIVTVACLVYGGGLLTLTTSSHDRLDERPERFPLLLVELVGLVGRNPRASLPPRSAGGLAEVLDVQAEDVRPEVEHSVGR